jgi:putative ABC transport system substrate-binding protein
MKKNVRSIVVVFSIIMLVAGIFSGCSKNEKVENSKTEDQLKKIGIIQIVEHPSLNTIRESFIKQLEEQGFKDGENIVIDYQNAQGDQTNLKTISNKFVDNNYDLIVAIATPSAQSAVGATGDIPILFSACTDPLGAGLVLDMDKPGKNVTGTSDAVSAEKIMELAKRITPDIKTIGALYNSSETNSISVVNDLKEYAKENGMTVIEATVTNSSEVQQVTQSLIGKVDAIFSPIDNTIATALPVVSQIANKGKVPFYVGADSMVKDGGLATYGINYSILGKETADMAVQILNGENPGDIPVKTMTDMDIYLNEKTANELGITIPSDVLEEALEIFK